NSLVVVSPSLASCVAHSICSPRAFQPRSQSLQPIRGPVATWSVWRGGAAFGVGLTNDGATNSGSQGGKHDVQEFLVLGRDHDQFRSAAGRVPGPGFGTGT